MFRGEASTGCCGLTHYYFYLTLSVKSNCLLQMSNTSSEIVSKVSLFSASATRSHEFSYYNVCMVAFCFSCLVSMTSGWRSSTLWAKSRKYNMTRSWINLEKGNEQMPNTVNSSQSPTRSHKALLCCTLHTVVRSSSTVYVTRPQYTPLFLSGNGPCEQQCTPVGGSPQCSCYSGFSLRADGRSCEGKEPKPDYNAHRKKKQNKSCIGNVEN